ncbi:MAG: hypothetical protein QW279_00355 [Candidatus Jordarchaeaceae archaeon]
MSPKKLSRIPTNEYLRGKTFSEQLESCEIMPVYRIRVYPKFSPIDINIQFIMKEGWSDADRLRFWTGIETETTDGGSGTSFFSDIFKPSLIIRRYDKEKDALVHINISIEGEIEIFSNDSSFAKRYLRGLFLDCPPSFHTTKDIEIHEEWVENQQVYGMFLGMLYGALGWSSSK